MTGPVKTGFTAGCSIEMRWATSLNSVWVAVAPIVPFSPIGTGPWKKCRLTRRMFSFADQAENDQ